MKISSSQSTTGVSGTDPNADSIQQSLDDLERLMQQVQTQQKTGVPAGDPNQLSQGIQNNLKALQGPQERGQLTPEQDSRVQNVLQSLGAMMQQSPQPTQNATGFPTDDKYEAKKVGGHHGGGHKVATPPVDDTDPDSNGIPTDSGS